MWQTYSYSARGLAHRQSGIMCQDRTLTYKKDNMFLIALADGAGSAKYCAEGAQCAVNSICVILSQHFDELIDLDSENIIEFIAREVNKRLNELSDSLNCEKRMLSSTLLAVIVKNGRYLAMHVGDGAIGCFQDDAIHVLSQPENGIQLNMTYFIGSDNVLQHLRVYTGDVNNIKGFILMSDGSSSCLYQRRTGMLAPAISRMFRQADILSQAKFQALLMLNLEQVIVKNTSDDCSIAMMIKKEDNLNRMSLYQALDYIDEHFNSSKARIVKLKKVLRLIDLEPSSVKAIAAKLHLKDKYVFDIMEELTEKGLVAYKGNLYYRDIRG